jgi:uncharacterized membrane protein
MVDVIRTVLALLAVAILGVALFAMSTGNLTVAGMSFLSASLVIYFRETR